MIGRLGSSAWLSVFWTTCHSKHQHFQGALQLSCVGDVCVSVCECDTLCCNTCAAEWSEKQQSFLRVRCRAMGYRLVLRESNPLARAWQVTHWVESQLRVPLLSSDAKIECYNNDSLDYHCLPACSAHAAQ
eukprot:4474999-Amphidinium_carterae.1